MLSRPIFFFLAGMACARADDSPFLEKWFSGPGTGKHAAASILKTTSEEALAAVNLAIETGALDEAKAWRLRAVVTQLLSDRIRAGVFYADTYDIRAAGLVQRVFTDGSSADFGYQHASGHTFDDTEFGARAPVNVGYDGAVLRYRANRQVLFYFGEAFLRVGRDPNLGWLDATIALRALFSLESHWGVDAGVHYAGHDPRRHELFSGTGSLDYAFDPHERTTVVRIGAFIGSDPRLKSVSFGAPDFTRGFLAVETLF